MVFRFFAHLAMFATVIAVARSAHADLIKSYQGSPSFMQSNEAPGEEVLTPTGGPWNNIKFSWYDSGLNPVATGNLFILTKPYQYVSGGSNGLLSGLSSSTPGFVAESTGMMNGLYQFAPSVTLSASTEYYFYTNAYFSGPLATATGALAANLVRYLAIGSTEPMAPTNSFHASGNDSAWLFQLDGTKVPEPSRIVGLLGLAGVGLIGLARRRRRTNVSPAAIPRIN